MIQSSHTLKKINYFAEWKRFCQECREADTESEYCKQKNDTIFGIYSELISTEIEQLHKQIDHKERVIRTAHK